MPADRFTVLVASDGSPDARAAVAATLRFPWPARTRVLGVVATGDAVVGRWPASAKVTFDHHVREIAAETQATLARRWPDAESAVVDGPAAQAIVAQARRVKADVIVLGSRGRSRLGRLLLGHVSRHVVHEAQAAVLVVRGRPRQFTRVVVGVDGSPHARRAVALMSRLTPPSKASVTVVGVVEPTRAPSIGPMPGGVRSAVLAEIRAADARTAAETEKLLRSAADELEGAGWRARASVRKGVPLTELLRVADTADAHLLVVGARGAGAIERLLLGSVADGALNQSPVSVLVVR